MGIVTERTNRVFGPAHRRRRRRGPIRWSVAAAAVLAALAAGATDTPEPIVPPPGAAIPAPPLPRVIRKLWHPGLAGVASHATVGAISGEVVSAEVAVQPTAPTPVSDRVVGLTFDDGPWPDTP